MPLPTSRILLIADEAPTSFAPLHDLLARREFDFQHTTFAQAREHLGSGNVAGALVVADHHYFNGQQPDLIHLLDRLCDKRIGAVLMPAQAGDQGAADALSSTEGLMVISAPPKCNMDDIAGRLAGLISTKPQLDSLHAENLLLRRFDNGLHDQMTQIDEEMRLAARLQNDFLPRDLPKINGTTFHILFRPASYVSGDIYDVARLDEDHVGFYIADAVGHGMPAALLTIFIKRALKTKELLANGYRIVPPDEALGLLNEDLLEQNLSQCQFVTMIYGIINTKTLELKYARAGHPLPIRLHGDGRLSDLEAEGPLLGVFHDQTFACATVQLDPGDSVLIYSDGFETAFDSRAGDDSVANEYYREEFAGLRGPNPEALLQAMIQKLDNQQGSLHPRDDLTAVLLSLPQR